MISLIQNKIAEISVSYSTNIPSKDRLKLTGSQQVADAARSFFTNIDYRECFYALYLNRANHVLGFFLVSAGGLTGTVVDQRMIFQVALKCNAHSIILLHNHPSGNLSPSQADIDTTKKLKSSSTLLEIPILDHLIITSDAYY